MKISITARHFSISEDTRTYVDNEIQKVEKIFDRIVSANIILERIKDYEYETEIIIQAPLKTMTIHEKDEDLIKSVDLAVNKIIRQLKKYKGHFKTKHEKLNDDQ
ncbi:MAG: ribosome-associated translation inhibitor RaiA [Candidatus Marinimicrobia bacterium]|nr:ribosome-associated translation inhibitor RaiA [Candidatus Neomarinimicrobiota bacterium]